MKIFWLISLLFLSTSVHSATAYSECDKQLVKASQACSDMDNIEECIMEYLANTECRLEILNDENVDICKECSKE